MRNKKIIRDIRNFFRLKKELSYTGTKDVRNHFRLEKVTKVIEDRVLKDIKNLCEHEEQEANYYKPIGISKFWSKNYIEYESNSDRNKTLSVEESLNKFRPY